MQHRAWLYQKFRVGPIQAPLASFAPFKSGCHHIRHSCDRSVFLSVYYTHTHTHTCLAASTSADHYDLLGFTDTWVCQFHG